MNPDAARPGPLSGCRIWVVEDVATLRMLTAANLRAAGAEVAVAANAAEARALLAGNPAPDLICLDLDLPDADGVALARELGPERCHAYTANATGADRERCLRAGFAGIIDKSVPANLVITLVQARAGQQSGSTVEAASPTPKGEEAEALQRRYLQFVAEQRTELLSVYHDWHRTPDAARVRRIAHRLSGTAVHFGLPKIGLLARALAAALDREHAPGIRHAFEHLDEEMSRSLEIHHRVISRWASTRTRRDARSAC